jgi:hypothetical protein
VQAEARYYLNGPIVAPGILKSSYVAAGADVRAIEQDTSINSLSPQFPDSPIRYDENLDTHYYGGYLAIGGKYTLFPRLAASWGFRSFFNVHVGVYDANTDYSGA